MTEEVKPEVVDEVKPVVETPAPEQAPELTPLEQEMAQQGWKPRDQFEGSDEEFVSAAEYKRRGELFKKIAETNRRLDKANATITALSQHQKQVYQAGFDTALKQLRADHKVAVEAGDAQTAAAIVDKIEETKAASARIESQPAAPLEPPAVLGEFMERNKAWYQKDEVMTAYADRVGHQFASAKLKEGFKPEFADILDHVESKVREKFPSSFGSRRSTPSVVEGSSTPNRPPVASRNAFGEANLTQDEKAAMKTFIDMGIMTKEEYIADIKKIRGNR